MLSFHASEFKNLWFHILLVFILHKLTFANSYSALVWGSSVKHKPQRVGKVSPFPLCSAAICIIHTRELREWFFWTQEHELEDEDVVQIIKKV